MATIAPEIQRAIAKEYQWGVRGHGSVALARRYGCHYHSVLDIVKRAKVHGGDPVAPRGHKRRKLNSGDVQKLEDHLDRNPDATNVELAAVVGNKIAPRTVSDYTVNSSPPFVMKKYTDVEPAELTEEWKEEGRAFTRRVKRIAKRKRVYEDETGVYSNQARRSGRGRAGQPLLRPRKRRGTKRTLHVYTDYTRVRYWTLRDKNANDAECKLIAKRAARRLNEGEYLIWDRLGATRRTKNPKSQHWNPEIKEAVEARGATLMFLPWYGKYWNPCELLFNDLKPNYIAREVGKLGREATKKELERIIRRYMNHVAPAKLRSFFDKRANGHHVKEMGLLD